MLLQELVEEDFGLSGRGKWYHSITHDSLVVNAEDQTFFWNSTGLRGNALDYLILVRGMKKDQAREFLNNSFGAFSEKQESAVAKPYDKLVEILWSNGINHREYWYKRCLKDETIDRRQLGYYDGWFTVPIYDEKGNFSNIQMRRDEPEKKIKYWYSTGEVYLYNSAVLNYTKIAYITEGLVDSILLSQEGLPCVSATGVNTWQPEWFIKFSKMENIYYFEDNDTAGRIGSRSVAKSLGLDRVKIVSFGGAENKYDVGSFFQRGGTKEKLLELANNNYKYIFELEGINVKRKNNFRSGHRRNSL